ncbi:MAG: transketolase, partial [Planctomycetota bacterium]
TEQGKKVRVVSMPCMDLFAQQDAAYIDEVLPPSVTNRVAVEAGIRMCWDRWIGLDGRFVGMSGFGASGPYSEVYEHFGINAAAVVQAALS